MARQGGVTEVGGPPASRSVTTAGRSRFPDERETSRQRWAPLVDRVVPAQGKRADPEKHETPEIKEIQGVLPGSGGRI